MLARGPVEDNVPLPPAYDFVRHLAGTSAKLLALSEWQIPERAGDERMPVIQGGIRAVRIQVQSIERPAHIATLIAGVSKQTSAIVAIVAESVCHGRHDSHRVALFQFCLQRVVIRVGAPFKDPHITEETGHRRSARRRRCWAAKIATSGP